MKKYRILISPLDWGLGHASRCVPVIQRFLNLGAEVFLAGSGQSLELLKKEFPFCPYLPLQNYQITFRSNRIQLLHLILQLPSMFRQIKIENQDLKELIQNHQIDAVISDNRYGLYSKEIPSVLITHQLFPRIPFLKGLAHRVSNRFIRKFDFCWVPDFEGKNNLAGILSCNSGKLSFVSYIGPLSRFKPGDETYIYDVVVVLSGPETQRTKLENEITRQLNSMKGRFLIVRGTSPKTSHEIKAQNHIEVLDLLDGSSLEKALNSSRFIVCRSGYSGIMDLVVKGRNAILIPTPGQTEQEYLASYHRNGGQFIVQFQANIDLEKGIRELMKLKRPEPVLPGSGLDSVIEDFYDSLN